MLAQGVSVKTKSEKFMFKKPIVIFVLLFSTFTYEDEMDTPRSLVEAFISDYQRWNDNAHSLLEAEAKVEHTGKAMKMAEKLYYKNIISKYCKPNFKAQPIFISSNSPHESEREVILTEEIYYEKAIVTTQHTDRNNFVAYFEYRFIKGCGRWFLEAVDYVDCCGKYPWL